MGDEPLLPLNSKKHSRIQATAAKAPIAAANRRYSETVAEMWPEISFRERHRRLKNLLEQLRRHFQNQLDVRLVRYGNDVRFHLQDAQSRTIHQLTVAEACQVVAKNIGHSGQLFNQQC